MSNKSWEKIFVDYKIDQHDFTQSPFPISNTQIKKSVQEFTATVDKEVRILCKQDTRESRPKVFRDNGLFLLPTKNGSYSIILGEGYLDIPEIKDAHIVYTSKLDFELETSKVGNSEMQHLDFAYASSIIRTFMNDDSLVLTIRGRKYTPRFEFKVGGHNLVAESVQTEVDAGYEGRDKIVLVEAKNSHTSNVIIRQLYYPFRQWQEHTKKKVITLFFEKRAEHYSIWQYEFADKMDYNSIILTQSRKYELGT
jgi:hypothetical protein